MAFDKVQYWKDRMQDNLHTFDVAFTDLQKDIMERSSHLDLKQEPIVKSLNNVRQGMIELAKAIQFAEVKEKAPTIIKSALNKNESTTDK